MTDELSKKAAELKAELHEREAEEDRQHEERLRELFREAGIPLRRDRYILQGDKVVAVDTPTWAVWFENHFLERVVARTVVQPGLEVSTVFLGLDHGLWLGGPPLVFETLVFGGLLDGEMDRYSTMAEALTGH